MRHMLCATALLVLVAHGVQAQDVTIPLNIEKLSAKAVESVNVTVDGALLQLAAKFLSRSDPEQRAVKNLISNVKGVYVRSFEFAGPGQYSDADVDALRAQLKGPQWSRMVNVRSTRGGENVDVFFKMDKDRVGGLVLIAAEPYELTIVNIVGAIDLDQLASLGGYFGIPQVSVGAAHK